MGPEIGRGIGDAMVFFACCAALCAPVALATVIALPMLWFGAQTAAQITWGIGIFLGVVAFSFVLNESR